MEPTLVVTTEIRKKALRICRDYLNGAWKQIDKKDLVLKRVNGGLSNWLYYCALPDHNNNNNNNASSVEAPSQVLLRFYGQVHGTDARALESLLTETVVFALLSERKLGPRLHGIFPGGRIEEFIPARPLQTAELRDPELSKLITQKVAQIHSLNIPISKEPTWLWGTLDRWMGNIRENLGKISSIGPREKEIISSLIDYNLDSELRWLKKLLPSIGSPVVFSHNDLQEGNILIRSDYKSPEEKLVLIDFEYCSYNYRGFDLANHFCEWGYNYNVAEPPHFVVNRSDLPSAKEQLRFIRSYLAVLRREYVANHPDYKDLAQNGPLFDEDHVLKEIAAFTLCSHFFWAVWAIVNAQISKIPFGYWEYGISRLDTYFKLKNEQHN